MPPSSCHRSSARTRLLRPRPARRARSLPPGVPARPSAAPAEPDRIRVRGLELVQPHRRRVSRPPRLECTLSETRALLVSGQAATRCPPPLDVVDVHEQAVDAVLDQLWQPAHAAGDHRHTGGECLDHDTRQPFRARRHQQSSRVCEQFGDSLRGDGTEEFDAGRGKILEALALLALPDDLEPRVTACSEQGVDALFASEAAYTQECRARAVPALGGLNEVRLHPYTSRGEPARNVLLADEPADRQKQRDVLEGPGGPVERERRGHDSARSAGAAITTVNHPAPRHSPDAELAVGAITKQGCRKTEEA